jgi:hypothetical protein
MSSDRGEPWAGSTYNGFSGPGATPPQPEPRSVRRLPAVSRRNLILGGIGAAVLAGLAFGLWARPSGQDPLGAQAEAATSPAVPIEVNQPQPLPTPKSAGRMEVLPAEMIQQARANAPVARPPRAETGLPEDVSAISPQVEDPPEARWAPPEQRLSRAERRALREQRWADDAPPPPRIDARPLDAPPPDEDDDSGY